jgi:hypothetical protein
MMKSVLGIMLLFFLVIINSQCFEKCNDASTGPPNFTIEIISVTTGEDVFTKGTYQSNQITIIDEKNQNINFRFFNENSVNLIQIRPASEAGNKTIKLKIGNEVIININFEIIKASTKCGTNYSVRNISIGNYQYEQSNQTGIIKINI